MKRNIRRFVYVLAALAAATLVALALRPGERLVEIARVDRGPVEEVVSEEGRTYVHERYTLSAPVNGYRPRVDWHVGDPVRAGELLLQLQPTPSEALDPRSRAMAEADVARARAALEAARANAEAAEVRRDFTGKEYARLKALFDEGNISRQVIDQAEYAAKDARAFARGGNRNRCRAARIRCGAVPGQVRGR